MDSVENIVQKHHKSKELRFHSLSNVSNSNHRYESITKTSYNPTNTLRSSYDNLIGVSPRDSLFSKIQRFDPIAQSVDLSKVGAVGAKCKINTALRKTNQRLLKNVDFPMLKRLMEKEGKTLNTIKGKKIQLNDYDIKENARPNKMQLMSIPQKPVEVYD